VGAEGGVRTLVECSPRLGSGGQYVEEPMLGLCGKQVSGICSCDRDVGLPRWMGKRGNGTEPMGSGRAWAAPDNNKQRLGAEPRDK
jgi:hypothetical protein